MNDLEQLAGANRQAAYIEAIRQRADGAQPHAGDALRWGFFAGIGMRVAWSLCTAVLLAAMWAAGYWSDRPSRVIIQQSAPSAPAGRSP